jgi:hypothetical protein
MSQLPLDFESMRVIVTNDMSISMHMTTHLLLKSREYSFIGADMPCSRTCLYLQKAMAMKINWGIASTTTIMV